MTPLERAEMLAELLLDAANEVATTVPMYFKDPEERDQAIEVYVKYRTLTNALREFRS